VAVSDLKMVQGITSAMNKVNAVARRQNELVSGTPRNRINPTPRIEPRKVYHPTPRFEPRFTRHLQPQVIQERPILIESEHSYKPSCPLPAPWKTPVWKEPIQPNPSIKVVIERPDIVNKGSLIDFFI
jgi:hypothetical protein